MTFFAKWRIDQTPPDIVVGACSREIIPLQRGDNERLVVMDSYHPPRELYVEAGTLKSKVADRVVEVEYLDDEKLSEIMIAVAAQRDPNRSQALQRLRGVQTFADVHAALTRAGIKITDADLVKARRDRSDALKQ